MHKSDKAECGTCGCCIRLGVRLSGTRDAGRAGLVPQQVITSTIPIGLFLVLQLFGGTIHSLFYCAHKIFNVPISTFSYFRVNAIIHQAPSKYLILMAKRIYGGLKQRRWEAAPAIRRSIQYLITITSIPIHVHSIYCDYGLTSKCRNQSGL